MFAADAVDMGRQAHDQRRHVETVSARLGSFSKAEEFIAREAQLFPIAGKVSIHQVVREDIVPCRYGGVCREDGALADQLAGFRMGRPLLNQLTHPLQGEEGRVPFVGMPDRWRDIERAQHAHATDPQ